jgi:hypothetical protein
VCGWGARGGARLYTASDDGNIKIWDVCKLVRQAQRRQEGREFVGGQEAAEVVAPLVAPDVARWGDEVGGNARKSLLPSQHHAQVAICVCVCVRE